MTTRRTLLISALLLLIGLSLGAWLATRQEAVPARPHVVSQDPQPHAQPRKQSAAASPDPEIVRPAQPSASPAPDMPEPTPAKAAPTTPQAGPLQIEEAQADQPDPSQPIRIDFVQKDIKTVMHYIGLKSGLQIVVDGSINKVVTVMYAKADPMEAIRTICSANNLDCVEDGKMVIIKDRR